MVESLNFLIRNKHSSMMLKASPKIQLPVETMNWGNFVFILALAVIFALIGMFIYRQRDLIGD